MKIKTLMTRDVQCCQSLDSTSRAAQIMWEHDCGVVPVVDEDKHLVGVITDRDVCMAGYTTGRPLADIRVAEVMTREVRTCNVDDSLPAAEAIMKKYHVRRLPVVDAGGRVVGILSLNDVARHLAMHGERSTDGAQARNVAETLAAVCQPWSSIRVRTSSEPKNVNPSRAPVVETPAIAR